MADGSGTRYAAVGDADVAYRVVGAGPIDVLYFYGLGSHIELMANSPAFRDFTRRLASFSRVLCFDRRGTGASDGVPRTAMPTVEEWTEDVRAVVDASNSERTAIVAGLDAGPVAMMYAALHPDRVAALVLVNTTARYRAADDYPIGASDELITRVVDLIASTWGTTEFARAVNPGMGDDDPVLETTATWARFSATPRTAAAQFDYILRHVDVREALPLVQAPTLVLHVGNSTILPIDHGRYIADHIEGAKLVRLSDGGLAMNSHLDAIAAEAAQFLTGERPPIVIDRVLTTVLFTDIVESTQRAASLGDRRWHTVLDEHDKLVRHQLRHFRGSEIKTTGDGFVAAFDGPARAVRCAQAIIDAAAGIEVPVRAGVHTGECEVRDDDLGGIAVHVAARVVGAARPGEVLVTSTVRDLVAGSGLTFTDRGRHAFKGVPDEWALLAADT